jgi:hypothetical protein
VEQGDSSYPICTISVGVVSPAKLISIVCYVGRQRLGVLSEQRRRIICTVCIEIIVEFLLVWLCGGPSVLILGILVHSFLLLGSGCAVDETATPLTARYHCSQSVFTYEEWQVAVYKPARRRGEGSWAPFTSIRSLPSFTGGPFQRYPAERERIGAIRS